MHDEEKISIRWSVDPSDINQSGRIDRLQLRGAFASAAEFWRPVIGDMVRFEEVDYRFPPRYNHITVKVGEVDRSTQKNRVAQNQEIPGHRYNSIITLSEDVRWQTEPWPRQWWRQHWAWIVLAHEIGHNLDIPHLFPEVGKPGLLEWAMNNGMSMRAIRKDGYEDWVMAAAVPMLKRRMTNLEVHVYRQYFINNKNNLWKGDLEI